ncbi:uncharacterized protein LOC104885034 isoform X1 [Beta vulgaris subsp. vulgaris]|uniref:uncharacterized protein LOC104885034 isoform X1 n=1 Tax=Beta vulgaris subsp. vulgaris TaxID=3555 RepID=UPI0020373B49|nr:uncharacterized protein LOC104885034 isoform X1 [Beta vulgaris subsp. vulgaris]
MASALVRGGRSKPHLAIVRHSSTLTTTTKASHHKEHSQNQVYLKPNDIIGSWSPPKDPKEAEAKLALLRRDYAKQVKELRKQYIHEMELQRQEQLRKDEARKVEILRQREERNKSKAAAAQARAAERKAFEEEFRHTLMKERAQKLDYWRMREKAIEERKKSKTELIRRQSSMWIEEKKLERNILENVVCQNT